MTLQLDLTPPTARTAQSVPFVAGLAGHGNRTAVITRDGALSYGELAGRVADVARTLGTERRLIMIAGENTLDSLVTYLGALAAGHPVLLAPGDNDRSRESLVAAYDPDIVCDQVGGEWTLDVRRDVTTHDLHPGLALLLSTSGSTGSPKLVRLSHRNLQANAKAIAEYLGIQHTDRAATTLPMHYCYGLSVIHSHLLRGAGLVLTDLSVVDACFWDLVRDSRTTTIAGVPHTFELLDRVGFDKMRLPHLRYVTQAGGRLAPDRVCRYAELGRRQGWDLVVMYGQTEATARMAYLPPELATSRPQAIGVPIPGGRFTLEPVPELSGPDAGELVYHGKNVMLGYAETPSDLRLGRTVHALRTGDLARRTTDGLYEVVGRRSRFVKIFGLRIDLQRVEALLAGHGVTGCCTDADDGLVIAVEGDHGPVHLAQVVAAECGIPQRAVHVRTTAELPRLATGKPDYQAVRELAASALPDVVDAPAEVHAPDVGGPPPTPDSAALCELYAELLGRADVTDDSSFVSLGGDSLSYVEMSVRLEEALGQLPANWHTAPIRDLVPAARRKRRFSWRTVETSVALRAAAIIMIVGTHVSIFSLQGSAHVLLAVAGFNFARFQLTTAERRERLRHQLASIARVAVPSVIWIAVAATVLTDAYTVANVFLLNGLVGPETWTSAWHFWFVEVLVYVLIAVAALLAIPWVDRLERRYPFEFVLVLLAAGLITRYELVGLGVPHPKPVFWLFALGWAVARASTVRHRVLLTAVIVATVPGFFDNPWREAIMIGGMLLLLWVRNIACPAALGRVVGVLASSSLYIYLVHWQVYPRLVDIHPVLALVGAVAVGIAYWLVATRVITWITQVGKRSGSPPQVRPA